MTVSSERLSRKNEFLFNENGNGQNFIKLLSLESKNIGGSRSLKMYVNNIVII